MSAAEDLEARSAREWVRSMFANLSPERRARRSYSLTFVSQVLKRSTNEVRALVESGALSAGRTKSGRLVFSIDDLLAFAMIPSGLETPSVDAGLAANVLADGKVLEVAWQDPATSTLVGGGRLEPDPAGRWLLFRDLSTGTTCTIEFAQDPPGRAVMRCPGCGDLRLRLYRAQTGRLVCRNCAGLRPPTEEELRRATALLETFGPPPGPATQGDSA